MTETTPGNKDYLDSLNLLRGVAAVFVCFCHLGGALATGKNPNQIFKFLLDYGKYGVHIFFVISGFVIPLSLYKGNYRLKNYFTFLYKRLLRLHPPYIFALILTLIIMLASDKLKHIVFPENAELIIKDFFYLHIPGDNPVFWSLAIEAQYYLFIGLFFCLINSYPKMAIGAIMIFILFKGYCGFSSYKVPFSYFLIFFMVGNVCFLIYTKIGAMLANYLTVTVLIITCLLGYGLPEFLVTLGTALTVLYYKKRIMLPFKFLGKISYSLYLIHYPIGVKAINLLIRYVKPNHYHELFIAVFFFIVAISWFFFRLIEYPSEYFSRRIRYKD